MKKIIYALLLSLLVFAGCSTNETTPETSSEYSKDTKIFTDYYVGQLLQLDANLVGADLTLTSPAWEGLLDDVVDTGQSMELVASVKPELIITMKADLKDQYEAIAPTIVIPYGTYDEEQIMIELGKLIGQEQLANEWISSFNAQTEQLKTKIKQPDYTYSLFEYFNNDLYMYGADWGRGGYIIYDKLGLKGTPDAEVDVLYSDQGYLALSNESIANYAGDVVLLTATTDTTVEEFKNNEIYQNLEAVKSDRVYPMDGNLFYHIDPISLQAQFEIIEKMIEDENL